MEQNARAKTKQNDPYREVCELGMKRKIKGANTQTESNKKTKGTRKELDTKQKWKNILPALQSDQWREKV